ncbi:MAG: transporter, partial [Sphaerisporangium sp.]|nr:transporter [Sphaerisporangium sp.]
MFTSLPGAAKAMLWVRILNQVGAYALAFLAVFAGPAVAVAALVIFGVAALISRWAGAFILGWLPPRILVSLGLGATGLSNRTGIPWRYLGSPTSALGISVSVLPICSGVFGGVQYALEGGSYAGRHGRGDGALDEGDVGDHDLAGVFEKAGGEDRAAEIGDEDDP